MNALSKFFSSCPVWGFALAVSFWSTTIPALANRPAEESPQITLRVYNYALVSSKVLAQAKEEVKTILREAGLSTLWLDCPLSMAEFDKFPACQEPWGPTDLRLGIVPRSMAEREPSSDNTLGFALPGPAGTPGRTAYVFYHRVADLARSGNCFEFQVLGNAIAHEVGHLLLGSVAHSATGIMKAKWNREELQPASLGFLRFTPLQASIIRNEVLNRVRRYESLRVSGLDFSK